MRKTNTAATERVLRYVVWFVDKYGYSPSVREIAAGVGLKSTHTVSYHLNRLADAGKISRSFNTSRSIVVNHEEAKS